MGNYKAYFVLTGIMGLLALGLLINVAANGLGGLLLLGLLQIPLGILQLVTGGTIAVKAGSYPEWVRKEIRVYWVLTVGYFIGLVPVIYAVENIWQIWVAWLFIVPWFIAVYQFGLIWRMAALRKRQLEKRELLQLFNH